MREIAIAQFYFSKPHAKNQLPTFVSATKAISFFSVIRDRPSRRLVPIYPPSPHPATSGADNVNAGARHCELEALHPRI
jgi:hypothetical protein